MQHTKNKGFTLSEMLVSLLLLSILILMLSSAMSVLCNITKKADSYVEGSESASYVLQLFQNDLVDAQSVIVSEDFKSLQIITRESTVDYNIAKSALFRNGKPVCGVLSGDFSATDRNFTVNMLLYSRSTVQATFYLRGYYNA